MRINYKFELTRGRIAAIGRKGPRWTNFITVVATVINTITAISIRNAFSIITFELKRITSSWSKIRQQTFTTGYNYYEYYILKDIYNNHSNEQKLDSTFLLVKKYAQVLILRLCVKQTKCSPKHNDFIFLGKLWWSRHNMKDNAWSSTFVEH